MAKPKSASKPVSSKAKRTAPAAKPAVTGAVKIDVPTVAAAVNALPQPTSAQVSAWLAQYPEGYASSLATQTRAPLVVGEAWEWFQKARAALEGPLAGAIRYPIERLAFLGRCLLDLAGALESERAAKRKVSTLSGTRDAAEALAQATLIDLRSAMREAAGRHPTLTSQLDARVAESAEGNIAGLLTGLANLLDAWLDSDDEDVRTLVASVKLTRDDVTNAQTRAGALTTAATHKRGHTETERDSAETTPLEGRVLVEMRALRNALANARDKTGDKRIPLLAAGPATRAVFGRRGDDGEPKGEPKPAKEPKPADEPK